MNVRRCHVLVLVALVTAGCRSYDPSVDLLETELRWLEDQLYALEDEYELQTAKLASCRRENTTLRKELEDLESQGGGAEVIRPPSNVLPPPRGTRPQRTKDTDQPPVGPPKIEMGEPQIDFGEPAPVVPDTPPKPSSPKSDKAPKRSDEEDGEEPTAANEVDAHVTHIVLNRQLTGGGDFDGAPGDEGVQVVVEPRNAAGSYVPLSGPVSVVVLDPAKQGQQARVARWDFDADETAGLMRKTLLGRGMCFELPWPNNPPEHSSLRLYVRYVTVDGRKLHAERDIAVDLPGQISSRWTPSATSSRLARRKDVPPDQPTQGRGDMTGQGPRSLIQAPAARTAPPAEPAVELQPPGGPPPASPEREEHSVMVQEKNGSSPAVPLPPTRRQAPLWTPYR